MLTMIKMTSVNLGAHPGMCFYTHQLHTLHLKDLSHTPIYRVCREWSKKDKTSSVHSLDENTLLILKDKLLQASRKQQ